MYIYIYTIIYVYTITYIYIYIIENYTITRFLRYVNIAMSVLTINNEVIMQLSKMRIIASHADDGPPQGHRRETKGPYIYIYIYIYMYN